MGWTKELRAYQKEVHQGPLPLPVRRRPLDVRRGRYEMKSPVPFALAIDGRGRKTLLGSKLASTEGQLEWGLLPRRPQEARAFRRSTGTHRLQRRTRNRSSPRPGFPPYAHPALHRTQDPGGGPPHGQETQERIPGGAPGRSTMPATHPRQGEDPICPRKTGRQTNPGPCGRSGETSARRSPTCSSKSVSGRPSGPRTPSDASSSRSDEESEA